jgi:hypothetical protein
VLCAVCCVLCAVCCVLCAVQASSPQALSTCLASMARLHMQPEANRLVGLLDRATDSLPAFTPWQLTGTVLFGVSVCHVGPLVVRTC